MTTLLTLTRPATTVGAALAAVHERWMQQVTDHLVPALSEDADFWTRWAGARFLADQFGDRFRLECGLLDSVAGLIAEEDAVRLRLARESVERTREALMEAGRRRATRRLTATLARQLIDQLALWFVEVEIATAGLLPASLPRPARRLLSHLRVADALLR